MEVEQINAYDEMSMFHQNAEEYGIAYSGPPAVKRVAVDVGDGRNISALVWGTESPEIVFLHGGAQNAHTWDTVALALGRPLVAIDLPGHGHSDGGRNGSINPRGNADDVAEVIRKLAPDAKAVVGMSLGGLTTLALVQAYPELVQSVVLVDVTPGVTAERSKMITNFVNGPETFPNFDDLLARTMQFNPTRSESSMRRGILHNAYQAPDGNWVWRYRRFLEPDAAAAATAAAEAGQAPPGIDFGDLWKAVESVKVPLVLARGMQAQSVVGDDDEAELLRRNPNARSVHFESSGHSIQGDEPVALAELITDVIGA